MDVDRLSTAKVLVVGDVMLDRYIYGSVARISPEAPVPVVKASNTADALGGAANVANNIASLKAHCMLIGVAGEDDSKKSLTALLDKVGIESVLPDGGVATTTKIRVIGQRQQMLRMDYEDILISGAPVFERLKNAFDRQIGAYDLVVLSDYGKGVLSTSFCKYLIEKASAANKPVVVDPKGSDWSKYTGATIITPNVKELSEVAGYSVRNIDTDIVDAGKRVREKYKLKYLVVTRSEKGITIISGSDVAHFPTQAQEVFDVSGAGDTVVATMSCAIAAGYDVEDAVRTANYAAGVVVSKMGTVPITAAELYQSLHGRGQGAALPKERALTWVKEMKSLGRRVVFTNGVFDILHRGHVTYLRQARSLGDLLIVGLNSDTSTRRLKGETRPVNTQDDRAFLLSALDCVDAVVIFDEDTPYELLQEIRPDVLVKGGDYTVDTIVGKEFAGEVAVLSFVDGFSTTKTIEKMRK